MTIESQNILLSDERIDEFLGLRVIQKICGPHFSLDAALLAKFATIKEGDIVADLGAGGGIISLILASNPKSSNIVAIEIQKELADIARRNVILNQFEDKIQVVEDDLRLIHEKYPASQFDLVVSNPPYRKTGAGRINPNPLEAISRHEIKCELKDILKASFYMLKDHGRVAFVYRPDRIVDLIAGCREYRLEPRKLQFVYPGIAREANLVLLEAIKNSRPELKILKPLIVSGHEIPD